MTTFLFYMSKQCKYVNVNFSDKLNPLNGSVPTANYMDNWKCTGILKGDGSPLSGTSGQPTAMSTVVGSSVQTSQSILNGTTAGR